MSNNELSRLNAAPLARLIRNKQVSPVEAITAAIAALDRLDPEIDAFCTPAREQALIAAKRLETRIARGEEVGPLAGVPVGIKDLVPTAGLRTTFGSRLYADYVPEIDDIAVERLRAAGAIVIGKTNAAEFGYGGIGHNPLFPTTRNPWDPTRTSGGSSAGSAAAVAAGICPLALGSDGGGSVRLPAAFCGIVGIKPTMGRIPLWPGCRDETLPGASGWESVEHYGPLARTVADAALFLAAVVGPDLRDRHSLPDEGVDWAAAAAAPLPRPLRIAWCPKWAGLPVDPEVQLLTESAAHRLAAATGGVIETVQSPIGDLIEPSRAIVAMETDLTGLRKLAAGREHLLSNSLRTLLSKRWSAEQFTDAITARKGAVNAMARFMARFDLLLTPTAPITAFPVDRDGPGAIDGVAVADDAWSPALYPANWTGQPAASVPVGLSQAGLPVGLQIVGRRLAGHRGGGRMREMLPLRRAAADLDLADRADARYVLRHACTENRIISGAQLRWW
jgi:aspartyl-tRNA(Asn)/glutamyl-tRNA(Gln) amidotransferase subunit A